MKKIRLFYLLAAQLTLLNLAAEASSSGSGDSSNSLHQRSTWDYVIVGNGTAGATLAAELAEGGKNSVLVLEWGENRTTDDAVLSPSTFAYSDVLTYDPIYAITQLVNATFNPFVPQHIVYSDGRMWGGSSAHNGLVAVRGTPPIYDNWATLSGDARWSYNNLLPIFIDTEHYTPNGTILDPTQRGTEGPLYITQGTPVSSDDFAIAVGVGTSSPQISDYNNPDLGYIGVSGAQQYTTPAPDSYRSFSINAFMPVGIAVDEEGYGLGAYKNLRVVSNALVNRVVFKHKKAVGVEYFLDGSANKAIYIKAKKKVILCAGSTASPGILERSGIGDATILNPLGIDVIVNNPNVGENLKNHYGAYAYFSGFTSADPLLDAYIDLSPYETADGTRRAQILAAYDGSGIFFAGFYLKPQSTGNVHIVSRNPTILPRLDLNMYSDGDVSTPGTDAYNIVSLLKLLPLIDAAYTGGDLVAPSPDVYLGGDAALLEYAQTASNMAVAFHASGTCRMSTSIANGVVDGSLHVFGVENLMVADVSIEPEIPDGNTAYGAYFIGKVAANIIKGE